MKCKTTSKHPLILKYHQWMKGASHILERDYVSFGLGVKMSWFIQLFWGFQLKEFYFLFKNKDGVLGEFYKFKFYYNFNGVEEENRVDPKVLYQQTKEIFDEIKDLGRHKKWDENDLFTVQIKFTDGGNRGHFSFFFFLEIRLFFLF